MTDVTDVTDVGDVGDGDGQRDPDEGPEHGAVFAEVGLQEVEDRQVHQVERVRPATEPHERLRAGHPRQH